MYAPTCDLKKNMNHKRKCSNRKKKEKKKKTSGEEQLNIRSGQVQLSLPHSQFRLFLGVEGGGGDVHYWNNNGSSLDLAHQNSDSLFFRYLDSNLL